MRLHFLSIPVLALCLSSSAFAADEHMEVDAPDLSMPGIGWPGSLSGLTGWGGGVSAGKGAGGGTVRDAALKMAMEKAAKEKGKQKKKEEDKNQYEKATTSEGGAMEALIHELGAFLRQTMDSGWKDKLIIKNPNGEEVEWTQCVPGGPLNPNAIKCTEERLEIFTDPTDGFEKWALRIAVVEFLYNPRHYYANQAGYYAEVVGNQSMVIVVQDVADLQRQMRQVAAAR